MSFMFSGCSSLKELNFSNFNTNNVTDMSCMFCECSSLIDINLYSFNTNNVTNMSYMFYGCLSLKNINLDNFNTIKVKNMICMFDQCEDELKSKIRKKNKIFNEDAFRFSYFKKSFEPNFFLIKSSSSSS